MYAHSGKEITALFGGLELVPPGIADTSSWRAGWQETALPERSSMVVGGVGRRP